MNDILKKIGSFVKRYCSDETHFKLIKKYFVTDFTSDGCVGRRKFITHFVLNLTLLFLMACAAPYMNIFDNVEPYSALSVVINLLSIVFIFFIIYWTIFNLTIGVRRLHDMNLGGGYYLLVFIPPISIILFLILIFTPGVRKNNRFKK